MTDEELRAVSWKEFLAGYYKKELEKYPKIRRGNLKLVVNNTEIRRKKVCPKKK